MERIAATQKAVDLIHELSSKHGELIFHQSGGCCDGSCPMIFKKGDMFINEMDVCLGKIAGVPFYMHKDQFEYWKHSHLTIDVTKGRGSSFSLEIPLGVRFIVHSRVFSEEELKDLLPVTIGVAV